MPHLNLFESVLCRKRTGLRKDYFLHLQQSFMIQSTAKWLQNYYLLITQRIACHRYHSTVIRNESTCQDTSLPMDITKTDGPLWDFLFLVGGLKG